MTDIEDYVKAYAFDDIRDIRESSITIDGNDEPAAEFIDNHTDRTFYMVLRTGHLLANTD